jgi:hypothetical protein
VSSSFSGLAKSKPKSPPAARKPAVSQRPQPGKGTQPGKAPAGLRQSAGKPTRRAQLSLERIEPWSVMKFSFFISLIVWVVLVVAVAIIYFTLSKLGVFTRIETTWGLVTYNKTHPGSNLASWFSASRVIGYTMMVGAVNVAVMTALATAGAVVYNLITMLSGGIEVTLKESD